MSAAPDSSTSPSRIDPGRGSPGDGGKQMALVVYILYFVGFATGITAVAGVILAHMSAAESSEIYRSHFVYQMRTFWFGLLTLVAGTILTFVLIGYLVLLWFAVWTLVRCIRGTVRLTNEQPIENPETLLW